MPKPVRIYLPTRSKNHKPRNRKPNHPRTRTHLPCRSNHRLEKQKMSNARMTDPMTSHLAAASISMNHKINVRTVILKLLELSEMTDPELCQAYTNLVYIGQAPKASEQHIRTSRNELHKLGLVHVVGTTKTESGRLARVWRKA